MIRVEPAAPNAKTFSLQIQNAEVTEVLEMLGPLSGTNIRMGKDGTGKVSTNRQDVTIEPAQSGILRSRRFVYEPDSGFVYVITLPEAEARKSMSRKLVSKVYRPHDISVNDFKEPNTPILTRPPIGRIAVTNPSEVGNAPDSRSACGDGWFKRPFFCDDSSDDPSVTDAPDATAAHWHDPALPLSGDDHE